MSIVIRIFPGFMQGRNKIIVDQIRKKNYKITCVNLKKEDKTLKSLNKIYFSLNW